MSNFLDGVAFLVVFLFMFAMVASLILILITAFGWPNLLGFLVGFIILFWALKRVVSGIDMGSGW